MCKENRNNHSSFELNIEEQAKPEKKGKCKKNKQN